MFKQITFVCCFVLLSWVVQSDAHHHTHAASLGRAPVGIYSRRGPYGESEHATSLGNAPVGLYHKHHHHHRSYRPIWKYPVLYGRPQVSAPAYGPPAYGPGIEGRRPCRPACSRRCCRLTWRPCCRRR